MKKIVLFIFNFSFFIFFSFSHDLSRNEERALSCLRELCFEVTRYNVTGHSPFPEASSLSEISRVGSSLMTRRKIISSVQNPVYLCESCFPEKIGIIDSTFCDEDLYSFSDEFSDSDEEIQEFDWVDQVLLGLNVPEGFVANPSGVDYGVIDGEKLLEILEKGDSRGVENEESKADDNPKEFTYAKNDGSLRRFSYDGEQFTVWHEGEDTVLVNFYGGKLVRKTFDSLYRLVKNERFTLGSSAKKMSLETRFSYAYEGGSQFPEQVIEELISEQKRFERHFDDEGRVVSLLESHYEAKNSEKNNGENASNLQLLNDKKTLKRYDSKGHLTEEESRIWSYKTNSFGRMRVEERFTKNVYEYGEDERLSPNVFFYENGELHLMRK